MKPEIYWITDVEPHRLAFMPGPRGDDWLSDEVTGWRQDGVTVVVSLLEEDEARMLQLADEPTVCSAAGMRFISFPIRDRGVPESFAATAALVTALQEALNAGEGVGIHCRAGIGRSALVAGCVLLELGIPPVRVFPVLSRARGMLVPDTDAQEQWLKMFARLRVSPS